MTSDIASKLDEINRKLQIIIENSYLSKLDLMFSVLLSLTIFGAGLLLTSFSLEKNVFRISLQAFFPILVYTLIGEAYSIIKDDAVARFSFWLVLCSNSIFLIYLFSWASIITFFGFLSIYVLLPLGYFFGIGLIIGLNYYLELFTRYLARLPTRFPNVMESYGREIRKLLTPVLLGVFIYLIAFLAMTICSYLVPA